MKILFVLFFSVSLCSFSAPTENNEFVNAINYAELETITYGGKIYKNLWNKHPNNCVTIYYEYSNCLGTFEATKSLMPNSYIPLLVVNVSNSCISDFKIKRAKYISC